MKDVVNSFVQTLLKGNLFVLYEPYSRFATVVNITRCLSALPRDGLKSKIIVREDAGKNWEKGIFFPYFFFHSEIEILKPPTICFYNNIVLLIIWKEKWQNYYVIMAVRQKYENSMVLSCKMVLKTITRLFLLRHICYHTWAVYHIEKKTKKKKICMKIIAWK